MPAVTRIGDIDLPHCSLMVRAIGSGSVFVNGRPVSFQGCVNTVHLRPAGIKCLPHVGAIVLGSTTVKVHGFGVGRFGDILAEPIPTGGIGPTLGCTWVAQGSGNVFCGG